MIEEDRFIHRSKVAHTLRNIKNAANDESVYDVDYVVNLLTCLLDNLQQYALDIEIDEELAGRFNDSQRRFLMRIAQAANRKTDQEFEDEEKLD